MKRIIIPFVVCMIACSFGCERKNMIDKGTETPPLSPERQEKVFNSKLAGFWYPGETNVLLDMIDDLAKNAEAQALENVVALIVPHAGIKFSGETALAAYKSLPRNYERIVIIGPSHRIAMRQVLSVPNATHYQTLLGKVALDTDFIDALLQNPHFQQISEAHENEHSVQIQIPLLQKTQQDFKLVPIVAGQCSPEVIKKVAETIVSLSDGNTLIVASSDFTHYGANYGYVPFIENVPEQLKKLDLGAYEHIAKLDATGFLDYCRTTGATICGSIPIAILLEMLPSDTKSSLIKYTTSGEITGDYSLSVSYMSVAFSGKPFEKKTTMPTKDKSTELTENDHDLLLKLARKTLEFLMANDRTPSLSELNINMPEKLKTNRAVFVTLLKKGQLRGCIGDLSPVQPLYMSVMQNAINAAIHDPRFLRVRPEELKDIKIEISALTVPTPVKNASDIRIGTDGVIIRKQGRRSVFLPHVAPEQGWGLEETLMHLSVKAGLPADAWEEGAEFLVFQAELFSE